MSELTEGILPTIARIQDLFETWRAMGHRRLPNGTELICRVPEAEGEGNAWMHVLFPRLTGQQIRELEAGIGRPLPKDLRTVYSVLGGMSLFGGMFRLHGVSTPFVKEWEYSLQPGDVLELNHELDHFAWKTDSVVAFAVNAWDLSVHAFSSSHPAQILRLERGTGEVLERHDNVWDLLDTRLHRLDELMLR